MGYKPHFNGQILLFEVGFPFLDLLHIQTMRKNSDSRKKMANLKFASTKRCFSNVTHVAIPDFFQLYSNI